ncbi:hypothetical protein JTB14_019032 [Gonioctena quinquepunctata]|nr:hypothetical protein JTB14_019032 [Gonioctena quinquepunctata]
MQEKNKLLNSQHKSQIGPKSAQIDTPTCSPDSGKDDDFNNQSHEQVSSASRISEKATPGETKTHTDNQTTNDGFNRNKAGLEEDEIWVNEIPIAGNGLRRYVLLLLCRRKKKCTTLVFG